MSAGTDTAPSGTSQRGRRRLVLGVAALVALVLATVLGGPPATQEPLDPRSTAPDGLRGLMDLAESMDGQVDISTSLPDDVSARVLLPRDDLAPGEREELEAWMSEGGTAVVPDPASPLHELEAGGSPLADLVGARTRAPDCGLDALEDVGEVTHGAWEAYEVPDDDAESCFALDDDLAWLVLQERGEGRLVSMGSPAPLVNQALDRDDNAVLAAALLFPEPGAAVHVLESAEEAPPTPVEELVPTRVWGGLGLLLLAAVVAVAAIARRLGRPVQEQLPPTVPSAELTRSLGDLLQRSGRRDGAATRLREAAREALRARVGTGLPPEALVEQAVARLGVPHEEAARALTDRPVPDDQELAAVADAVSLVHDRLRAPS